MVEDGSSGRIQLRDWLELELPDGSIVKVRPGPYGKGLSVVAVPTTAPKAPATPKNGAGKRGRRPRESTVKLRQRLEKDAKKGKVLEAKQYVKWVLDIDPTISLSVARQVVYRELRTVNA